MPADQRAAEQPDGGGGSETGCGTLSATAQRGWVGIEQKGTGESSRRLAKNARTVDVGRFANEIFFAAAARMAPHWEGGTGDAVHELTSVKTRRCLGAPGLTSCAVAPTGGGSDARMAHLRSRSVRLLALVSDSGERTSVDHFELFQQLQQRRDVVGGSRHRQLHCPFCKRGSNTRHDAFGGSARHQTQRDSSWVVSSANTQARVQRELALHTSSRGDLCWEAATRALTRSLAFRTSLRRGAHRGPEALLRAVRGTRGETRGATHARSKRERENSRRDGRGRQN